MRRKFFDNKTGNVQAETGPMSFARQARGASTIKMDTPKDKVTHIITSSMIEAVNKQLR